MAQGSSQGTAFTLGVCAMEKKSAAKPMQELLKRLQHRPGVISVQVFDQSMILNAPVEQWPVVDVLIAFFSAGFPLDKAEAYAALRSPFLVNDLAQQRTLMDRLAVMERLAANVVPTPRHFVVDRSVAGWCESRLQQQGDTLVYDASGDGTNVATLTKPFVEKPVDAEDHNVFIYYPNGGCCKMFRKTKTHSSTYDPDIVDVRRDGNYVYEQYIRTTGAKDVKVYMVGCDFGHAEQRKAPSVDGLVERTPDGKEVRETTSLSDAELAIGAAVVSMFRQTVCGFDLLRAADGISYVNDVNGWSFVKGADTYYDQCADRLYTMMLHRRVPWSDDDDSPAADPLRVPAPSTSPLPTSADATIQSQ